MANKYSMAEEQFINECVKAVNKQKLDSYFVLSVKENGEKRFQFTTKGLNLGINENILLFLTPAAIPIWKEEAGFGKVSNNEAIGTFKQIIMEQIDQANKNYKFQKSLRR